LAEVADGRLQRLEKGRDREAIAEHLLASLGRREKAVVGLDFAFSLPASFLLTSGLSSARDLWALTDKHEAWLASCQPPFWGKRGTRAPDIAERFRRTEHEAPTQAGIRAKSVFQIAGAGAVGTGSLRGMRLLHRFSTAGFSIWPFDPPGWPLVLEIYPRLLTGAIKKSHAPSRIGYLRDRFPELPDDLRERASSSEDAFDAAVSAMVMASHIDDLATLPAVTDRQLLLEGLIWHPGFQAAVSPDEARISPVHSPSRESRVQSPASRASACPPLGTRD
jgi:hypothetical protein